MGLFSGIFKSILGAGLSEYGASKQARRNFKHDMKLLQEQNRGALERQNDQQAFEEFLINRRNVAGGPAYGGPSGPVPNFWFGLEDQANKEDIAGFMESLQPKGQVQQPRRSSVDVLGKYSSSGKIDPNTPLGYQSREETQNPLYNLRRFLGQDATTPNPERTGG